MLKNREIQIFCKSNYIFEISRSRASKLYITCSYVKSLNFFLEPLRGHFAKIAHKVAKSKCFPLLATFRCLLGSVSSSKIIGGGGGGGGGGLGRPV